MSNDMDDDEELAAMRANFRRLREGNGWTLAELSRISGIRANVLADIEEAGRNFGICDLLKLCGIYHIRPAKIFYPVEIPGL